MWIIQWLRDYSIVLMLVTFVLMMVFTFWPGRQQRFERDGDIPLQDDRLGGTTCQRKSKRTKSPAR